MCVCVCVCVCIHALITRNLLNICFVPVCLCISLCDGPCEAVGGSSSNIPASSIWMSTAFSG